MTTTTAVKNKRQRNKVSKKVALSSAHATNQSAIRTVSPTTNQNHPEAEKTEKMSNPPTSERPIKPEIIVAGC